MAVSSHSGPFKPSLPHPFFRHRISSRSLATSSPRHRFCFTAATQRNEILFNRHEHEYPHTIELLHKNIESRQRDLRLSCSEFAKNNRTLQRQRVPGVPIFPGVRPHDKTRWKRVTEDVRNSKKCVVQGLVELEIPPPVKTAQKSSELRVRPYENSGLDGTSINPVSHSIQATTVDIEARFIQLEEQIVEDLHELDAKDLEHFEGTTVDIEARFLQVEEQIVEELHELDAKDLEHFEGTTADIEARFLQVEEEFVEDLHELDAKDLEHFEGTTVDIGATRKNWPANHLMKELDVDLSSYERSDMNGKPAVANNYNLFVEGQTDCEQNLRTKLCCIFDKVLVVDNVTIAREVVHMLTHQYRNLVHACDTEVSKINVKQDTPVHHGEVICFSIFSGEDVNYGNGKSCIWVDVLEGDKDILAEFAPFFEDSAIKKVWHNYSFDCHVLENYGIKLSGFHADTMHMARLWDSSRQTDGGYSLEALSGNPKVMNESQMYQEEDLIGKISMKTIFGRRKMKKDGGMGKIITIPPVEELQREERQPWICYSSLDSMSTLKLYQSLKSKLSKMPWLMNGRHTGNMLDFYGRYWRPFGELLVQMETEGILVDRAYLSDVEKVAIAEQKVAANRFRSWASKHCPDAKYMNVGSDTQLRLLLFGGICNRKNHDESLPTEKLFKIANVDNIIKEGKKAPLKTRDIKLHKIGSYLPTDLFTPSGWPSVSGDALKAISGKVSAEYDFSNDASEFPLVDVPHNSGTKDVDVSAYGTAYSAFGKGQEGREACHAIAALCEMCSIDSLLSNFILPLQGSHVSGNSGRIHCSLNINTETGRLSARRPNLQNQPALEKDRYKIRQAFIAAPGNSLIVADYGQLELRILAHLADCQSMKEAFEAGGDFHSRTAMNMYPYIREAVEQNEVILEWHPQPGEEKPPVPLLKDAFGSERRKAKMLNFSIAYGKTPRGLAKDWKVSVDEAQKTVNLWYKERQEVLRWQEARKIEAVKHGRVYTLLGRARLFPSMRQATSGQRGHIERAAINTPVQGSAADVAMCAMLEIDSNERLRELGWKLLLQVHDEVILEGPSESSEEAKALVIDCMAKPFNGRNILSVDLVVDAKCAQNWYAAK